MSVKTVLSVIFIPPIIGAALPFVFSGLTGFSGTTIGEAMVCATTQAAAKRGFVDAAGKKKLLAEATAAPGTDAKTKAVFEAAGKRGC